MLNIYNLLHLYIFESLIYCHKHLESLTENILHSGSLKALEFFESLTQSLESLNVKMYAY